MDNNIAFIYSTCDKYDDLWNPFFNQLKKNWPEMNMPVYLCTENKTYQHDGFNIMSPLVNVKEDISSWSKRLLTLLRLIPEEYIFFILDDFLLTKPVDNKVVEKVYDFMKKDKDIGFICLHQELTANSCPERKNNAVPAEIPVLHRCLKGMPYRITTQVGIWRKSFLIKLLKPFENAWQFEVRSNRRMNWYYDKYKIYDINEPLFVYPDGGIIRRGKFQKEYTELFDSNIVSPIIEKRGCITWEEWAASTGKQKHTLLDYWRFFLSMLP